MSKGAKVVQDRYTSNRVNVRVCAPTTLIFCTEASIEHQFIWEHLHRLFLYCSV